MFNTLSKDVVVKISNELSINDALSLSQTSKDVHRYLCENRYFWIKRLQKDHNIKYILLGNNINPVIYYKFFHKHRYKNNKSQFIEAVKISNIDIVRYLISNQSPDILNWALMCACEDGNNDMVKIVVQNGADPEEGFIESIRGYHLDIIEYLIGEGAQNWNQGLLEAAECGYLDLVNVMIRKGATNFNGGLHAASYNGHIEIAELMLEHHADNFISSFLTAISGGKVEIVRLLIKRGANDWGHGIVWASSFGHEDIVKLILLKGTIRNIALNLAFRKAAEGNHKNIVKILMDAGADDWNQGLSGAAVSGHESMVRFMIKMGANNFNTGLHNAAYGGHRHIVDLMIEYGADAWERGLDGAEAGCYPDLAEFFKNKM
jgi:ankyrin repeat protein